MAEDVVRCDRCHSVLGALGECEECASVRRDPARSAGAGSYAEKYRGSEYDVVASRGAGAPVSRRRPASALLAAGGLLLVAAIALGAAMLLAPPAPDGPPIRVYGYTPSPSPSPPPPRPLAYALAMLNDPDLCATVVVDARLTIDARLNNGRLATRSSHLEATFSFGNATGRVAAGRSVTEFRRVDGAFYARVGTGRWTAQATPANLELLPLLGLTDSAMVSLVGQESTGGQTLSHLQTTSLWQVDPARIAVMDLSGLPYGLQTRRLDIWVTPDGRPVRAAYTASTDTSDGTRHLLLLEATYAFRDLDRVVLIVAPR